MQRFNGEHSRESKHIRNAYKSGNTANSARRGMTLGVLLSIIFPVVLVFGQQTELRTTSLPSNGSLKYYSDLCQFAGPAGKSTLDVSYSLPIQQLIMKDSGKTEIARLSVQIILAKAGSDTILTSQEVKAVPLNGGLQADAKNLFVDIKKIDLDPGDYTFDMMIQDSATGISGTIHCPLTVRQFESGLSISDLLFVSHVQKAAKSSVFEKNGLLLIPNPSHNYFTDANQKNIYVYYEINHMSFQKEKPSFYRAEFTVGDLSGKTVFAGIKDAVAKSASNAARIEMIPLDSLNSGIYKFVTRVTDLQLEETREASGYFRVYAKDSAQTQIIPMSEADIQKYYDQIKYIATSKELKMFASLDNLGKQHFLINFWKSKDPTPGTPRNEFMEEHFRRIAICEQKFQGGINSDMGRIYIKYGPPMDIHRDFSSEGDSRPRETWIYALNGRTEFVFSDRIGDGNYVLINSTDPDEYKDPDWQNHNK